MAVFSSVTAGGREPARQERGVDEGALEPIAQAHRTAARPAHVMSRAFDREWIHVGGLSRRGPGSRSVSMRDRLKNAFVDAALLASRLTTPNSH
jgi:hypothetical protein